MKKILFSGLIFLPLLMQAAIPVLAQGAVPGAPCASPGALSDCTTGPGQAGCCSCDGAQWIVQSANYICRQLTEPEAGGEIVNPALSKFGSGEGAEIVAQLIASGIKIAFSLAGIVLLAMLILGGISWMTAGGDSEKIAKAQKRVTTALVGFAIFMAVFAIINYLAPFLGLDFLRVLEIQWPTP